MDKELFRRFHDGDEDAFAQIYDMYEERALRTAVSLTRSRDDAEDCVQEAFTRAYLFRQKYDGSYPFDRWFFRILINECRRRMARRIRREYNETAIDLMDFMPGKEDPVRDYELYDAIAALTDQQKECIILKYLSGFSEKEISKVLDLNQNTVKSRLFKARAALRKMLQEEEVGV